jgi:hypothetical protein
MTAARKAAESLARFRVGRRTLYVVPLRAIAYAAVSAAIVFLVLMFVDRWVLGSLEARGWTAGERWAQNNKRIEENDRRKTTTNECELRHWTGQPLPQSSGRRKILVMGDSFVWGPPYVTLNHLWWRQLAIELERRGYRDVDVLAVGHPGWSTHRQLECATHLIPEIKPDVVIWGYVTNDPDEKMVRQIFDTQDRFPLGQRARVALRRLFPSFMFKFESLRNQKLAAEYSGPKYGYAYTAWETKLLEGENFERYRQTVREVGELVRRSKVPSFLLTLPGWPCREYYEPRYAPVLPLWEAAGVPTRNTLDDFIARYGNAPQTGPRAIEWGINPADSHPGPKATHFHAVMAADYLEAHFRELLGPKDDSKPHELAINDWLPSDLHVDDAGNQWFALDYPAKTELMYQPPGEQPSALVALRYPLPLKMINLGANPIKNLRVWVSLLHPADPYDELLWYELLPDSEGRFVLPREMAGRSVAEIRFRCDVAGSSSDLLLELARPDDATERP